MQFLKSFDSEKIGYQIISQPQNSNKNIVVIPGFGGDINFLNSFLNNLKESNQSATIYFYSPRGHAFSSKCFPQHMTVENVHAQDFSNFVKTLNLKRFIVVGHSYGGVILQNYLNLENKVNPEKFFLICSAPKIFGVKIFKQLCYNLLSKKTPIDKPFSYQTPKFYKKFNHSWDIDLERWHHDTYVTGGILNWVLHFLSLSDWQNNNLNNLDQQTGYYLYGKKDIIIPKVKQLSYLKKLPKINVVELNSGHLAPITNPEETAKAISTYI